MKISGVLHLRRIAALAVGLVLGEGAFVYAAVPPPVALAQFPLTVSLSAHPQVLLTLGNSESMDGNLSGAIMTGSGSDPSISQLANSSSPVNYAIPASFNPPVNGGDGVNAPYTVSSGGNLVDNSPSRLNVAKQGITGILNSFMGYADFALMTYSTSNVQKLNTRVYYMSPNDSLGNPLPFVFTNTPPANQRVVANPCFGANVQTPVTSVDNDCKALQTLYGSVSFNISQQAYLEISASSDDPQINDVLYAGGSTPTVCTSRGGTTQGNPYTHYTLANYNAGQVFESYRAGCFQTTGPTNAGFVPYSQEVMYARRGWAYISSQSATAGTVVVPMQTAGATPTPASVAAAIAPFTPWLAPETSNTGTTEVKAVGGQSPMAGLMQQARTYFNSNPPTSNGCSSKRYVVLVTDGLPTLDLANHAWPPLGSAAAAGYGVTATFNADGSLNTTNDQALIDAIAQIQALATRGIKTYIIGVGAGVDPSLNPTAAATLTAMAVAGGTNSYFPATSVAAVISDMQVILAKILAATQSDSSVAVNSTGLHKGALAYQAQFTTSDTNQDWTGNLSAFPIDPASGAIDTTPSNAVWSARPLLDALSWNSRVIATWDPVANAGIPFRWTAGTPATGIATSTALGQSLQQNTADPNGQDALQFIRGSRAQEIQNGGGYRPRTHTLGDIVDSSPLYVGSPNGPFQIATYVSFVNSNANRPPVLFVGANDGMLHAFDAATGNERFAYIPRGVYQNLWKLTNRYYNDAHQNFVDASPQASDVQFSDLSWHTIVVGGEGSGGRSVYALDVTNPTAITSETALAADVLWDFMDADLGYTYSNPVAVNTNAGFVVMFGNGYDSNQGKPFLYVLDPKTGTVRAKLDLCAASPTACDLTKTNGLSNVVTTSNSGSLGYASLLYAGDLQGNLWRVDLSSSNPASWTATVLFQATDPGGARQPITITPAVTLNPLYPKVPGTMVFIGTGQMLNVGDLNSTQVQTVYGIYDGGASTLLKRSNLIQQTMGPGPGANQRQITSSNPVNLPTAKGWYVDFNLVSGERIVVDPQVDSGAVVVVSDIPSYNTTSCAVSDAAWLNEFAYATGGKFPVPQIDTGSGLQNSPVVAGIYLGNVYATTATIDTAVPTAGPNAGQPIRVKEIGLSSTAIQTVQERGPAQRRTSWWEIR